MKEIEKTDREIDQKVYNLYGLTEGEIKIVEEIKAELDKQEEMKREIETERNKIDGIIENAIR